MSDTDTRSVSGGEVEPPCVLVLPPFPGVSCLSVRLALEESFLSVRPTLRRVETA